MKVRKKATKKNGFEPFDLVITIGDKLELDWLKDLTDLNVAVPDLMDKAKNWEKRFSKDMLDELRKGCDSQ